MPDDTQSRRNGKRGAQGQPAFCEKMRRDSEVLIGYYLEMYKGRAKNKGRVESFD